MKLFYKGKDGGKESTVWGYWLVEIKSLFSIAVLRFEDGTRDAYHSHAFNCISWVLRGKLEEQHTNGKIEFHTPGLKPVITKRETFHKVRSWGRTWVFTLRGPWADTWKEHVQGQEHTLTHGRVITDQSIAKLFEQNERFNNTLALITEWKNDEQSRFIQSLASISSALPDSYSKLCEDSLRFARWGLNGNEIIDEIKKKHNL
jgi:hypothetical protein